VIGLDKGSKRTSDKRSKQASEKGSKRTSNKRSKQASEPRAQGRVQPRPLKVGDVQFDAVHLRFAEMSLVDKR